VILTAIRFVFDAVLKGRSGCGSGLEVGTCYRAERLAGAVRPFVDPDTRSLRVTVVVAPDMGTTTVYTLLPRIEH